MLLCQDMQLYSFTVNVWDSLEFNAALLTCAVFWPGVFWHFQVKTTSFTQVRHFEVMLKNWRNRSIIFDETV